MKRWALALAAVGVLVWLVGVCAQEVWNDIGSGANEPKKAEKVYSEESPYSWLGPNALARSSMFDRQERLQYKCDQMSKDTPPDVIQDPEAFRNLLVDDRHKLLYCYVPKVS